MPIGWRIAVVRHIAAAHVLAGVVEFLRVGGNLALQLPYAGGPLGIVGFFTVTAAQFINSLFLVSPSDPRSFLLRSQWIARSAGRNHDFLVAMVAAHMSLGVLNLAVSHGLWHRRRWGRRLELVVIGLAGIAAMAHGLAFFLVGGGWTWFGCVPILVSLLVAVPIVVFLQAEGTRVLFTKRLAAEIATPTPSRRPWWLLSLQWLGGLLAVFLALGIVLLQSLGPMVEVVWLSASADTSRFGKLRPHSLHPGKPGPDGVASNSKQQRSCSPIRTFGDLAFPRPHGDRVRRDGRVRVAALHIAKSTIEKERSHDPGPFSTKQLAEPGCGTGVAARRFGFDGAV